MTRKILTASSFLGLGLLLLGAGPGRAAEAAVPGIARGAEAASAPALPLVGVMADVGLPDGAGASLVVRPMKWLRVTGGGTYNMISSGVRAGASLLPFGWGPSLSVEGGHYFDGDANGLVR